MEHVSHENGTVWNVELGVDITEYQVRNYSIIFLQIMLKESVEFELLSVVGRRHEKRLRIINGILFNSHFEDILAAIIRPSISVRMDLK